VAHGAGAVGEEDVEVGLLTDLGAGELGEVAGEWLRWDERDGEAGERAAVADGGDESGAGVEALGDGGDVEMAVGERGEWDGAGGDREGEAVDDFEDGVGGSGDGAAGVALEMDGDGVLGWGIGSSGEQGGVGAEGVERLVFWWEREGRDGETEDRAGRESEEEEAVRGRSRGRGLA
jgi:hypothetical protein